MVVPKANINRQNKIIVIALILSLAITSVCWTQAVAQSQVNRTDSDANSSPILDRSVSDTKAGRVTSVNGWCDADDPLCGKLSHMDRKVLLECIKLARFSLYFHENTNRTGFWRSWIYPLEQESGTALSFTNTLIDLSQRARGLNNPRLISRPSLKRGLTCATIGQSITGTSSAIELAHNGYISLQSRRHGFSPAKSEAYVAGILSTIDALLDEREALVAANETMKNLQVVQLQGKLLRHIRNQLLYSFKQWSIRSRQTEWSENTFYAIDSLQAFTQLSSTLLAFKGFSNSRLFGPSSITLLIATSLVTVNPFLRTAVGRCMAKYQDRRLSKLFPQQKPRTMKELTQDWDEFKQITSGDTQASAAGINEVGFLTKSSVDIDSNLAREQRKMEALRRVADQQAIAGPAIGLLSLARATCATVAHYGYHSEPVVSNRISFAGRISQTTGQTFALIATPTAKIRSVLYTRKLAKSGKLPKQINQARLKKLDELEQQIKAAVP